MPKPSNPTAAGFRERMRRREVVEDLVQHPGWAVIQERIEQMLTKERSTLEQENFGPDQTQLTRGAIRACKSILNLPEIIVIEGNNAAENLRKLEEAAPPEAHPAPGQPKR